jgi:hypothetical protein
MTPAESRHGLPDGREVRASYGGALSGWTVRVVGGEDHARTGRTIHDALAQALELPDGPWPPWFVEAAGDLAGHETEDGRCYACPCCEYLTLPAAPNGTYEICDVCFWEDDGVQLRDPDYEGGANRVSLRQARTTFRAIGVSEARFSRHVRAPTPAEHP